MTEESYEWSVAARVDPPHVGVYVKGARKPMAVFYIINGNIDLAVGRAVIFIGGLTADNPVAAALREHDLPPRKTAAKTVDSPFEAALRARVNRIFTLANKLTGVDWTMVADGTHIALPSIAPFAAELRLEAMRLVELLDRAAERTAKR